MFCVLKEGQKSVYVERDAYSVCTVHVVRSILS